MTRVWKSGTESGSTLFTFFFFFVQASYPLLNISGYPPLSQIPETFTEETETCEIRVNTNMQAQHKKLMVIDC